MALSQKTKSVIIVVVLFAVILMPFLYVIFKEVILKPVKSEQQVPPVLDASQKN